MPVNQQPSFCLIGSSYVKKLINPATITAIRVILTISFQC